MNLLIEYTTCSQCGGERSNPQAEARKGELMSRNKSELDSASLHYMRVAKLPDLLKPVICGEEIFISNRRALRGDWRWRVRKDKSRNLRDPVCAVGVNRKSDGFIVAKKCVMSMERRRPTACVRKFELLRPLDLRNDYGTIAVSTIEANRKRSVQESRMREICTSGSMRGSAGKA